jgi:hypothetical protein
LYDFALHRYAAGNSIVEEVDAERTQLNGSFSEAWVQIGAHHW